MRRPRDVLAWAMEWYVREGTLREVNTCIINHHHGLELAGVFGGGTMSTSDGQRFPVRGKSTTARDVPDEQLAHISPAHSKNVNFFGVITVDVELAKLDGGGWRPLRPAAVEPSLRP
ncbi:Tn3 family transposase [Nonomuraea sp. NPDC050451]|uniref:Tn3 family transposase n=1 Tax=Nonomuraea sp. NPDC050451 TaxID=3364364 RepID=UPI00378FA548